MVSPLGSLAQLSCGEGGALQTSVTGVCGECPQCLGHTGSAPAHGVCAFPSTLLRLQVALQGAGPGLPALPRSKPLGFRFSGPPQRRRLGWACVLRPSLLRAAQATTCLASALSPGGDCVLSPPRSQPLGFLGGCGRAHLRCALCLFWEADLWLQAYQWMSTIQNPRESWLETGSLIEVLVEDGVSGAEFAPFWLWLPLSSGRWAGLQPASSPLVFAQFFVL